MELEDKLSTYCLVAAPRSSVGSAFKIKGPVNVPPDSGKWLAMLVAIVELTVAIRVSSVADVPALAAAIAIALTDVIAAEFTAIAELFAAILTLAVDNPTETVLILVVKTPEVDTSAADTTLIAEALTAIEDVLAAITEALTKAIREVLTAIADVLAAILVVLILMADVLDAMLDVLIAIAEELTAIDV